MNLYLTINLPSAAINQPAESTASIESVRGVGPLQRLVIRRAVRRQKPDATDEDIDMAIDAVDSGRPFLDWFTNGGFLAFLKAVLEIISAFK